MAKWLKKSVGVEAAKTADCQVRETVENILADIEARGDAAVRELALKFDKMERDSYRLSPAEIDACYSQLTQRDIADIEFAQAQVRNFAQHQRDSVRDLEVETLPGVILGHKTLPVNAAGCYVPGGKYPLLASAHPRAWDIAITARCPLHYDQCRGRRASFELLLSRISLGLPAPLMPVLH